MKENRVLVIMFQGNEVPENVLSRITREISTWAEANVEGVEIYALDSKELAKLIIPAVVHHNDATFKCKKCDDAIKELSEFVTIAEQPMLFTINLSTLITQVLQRRMESRLTDRDKRLLEAIKILGQGGPRTTSLCEMYGYTKEIDSIVRQIYNRVFDNYGKIKE